MAGASAPVSAGEADASSPSVGRARSGRVLGFATGLHPAIALPFPTAPTPA